MYLGTHACLPLVVIGSIDVIRISTHKKPLLKNWHLVFVGIAGIIPDILWPHTSIHDRLTSHTHTVWFILVTLPLIYLVSKWMLKENVGIFVVFFWLSIMLHVLVDMISGGVSLFYPFEKVIGKYYISWKYWIYSDVIFILVVILLFVIRSLLLRRTISKAQ